MVFYPPSWLPNLSDADIPDDVPLSDFIFGDGYRPKKCDESPPPFIDSVDGSGYGVAETKLRIEWLAAGLARQLGIDGLTGNIWQRVVSVFAVNNIHTPTLAYAVHRLNGIVSPANAAFGATEFAYQLKDSAARCIFTNASHLDTVVEAAKLAGISKSNVFLIPVRGDGATLNTLAGQFLTLEDLITAGQSLSRLPTEKWESGRARHQPAYLCYSSGTSGPPKGVIISHRNIIANIMQVTLLESEFKSPKRTDVVLGVLPQSHIYSIICTTHIPAFRGDTVITMAKFELTSFINAIKRFQMTSLYVVPPHLIALADHSASAEDPSEFDLPSVTRIFCGAAPLSVELTSQIRNRYPGVLLGQGYGMTEAACVISQHPAQVYDGSSGCLMPNLEVRLVDLDGVEVFGLNKPGEIWVRGPNVTLGYHKNAKATHETYGGGWLKSGDVGEFRLHPKTNDEHLFIVDRVKELIKVSGFQVAPAELEGHLLRHPLVADCAVIPVPDKRSGEVPKAVVVLSKGSIVNFIEAERELLRWVADHKSKHKRLRGGVEFVRDIPKSPNGKILRRLIREREKARIAPPAARL